MLQPIVDSAPNDGAPFEVQNARPWMIWVEREFWQTKEYSIYEKAVYTLLCGYADVQTRRCFPSLGTISTALGVSKSTVKQAINGLVEKHMLRRITRPLGKGRWHDTNVYLLFPFRARASDDLGWAATCPRVGREVAGGRAPGDQLTNPINKPNNNTASTIVDAASEDIATGVEFYFAQTGRKRFRAGTAHRDAIISLIAEVGLEPFKAGVKWVAENGIVNVGALRTRCRNIAKTTGGNGDVSSGRAGRDAGKVDEYAHLVTVCGPED